VCVCATCLLAYDAYEWTLKTIVDDEGEGHAGPCRWSGNDEERVLGLDWGLKEAGWPATVVDN
jgi:hypothetical protein